MAKCANCGTIILFGGVNDQGHRFCNERCHSQAALLPVLGQVPPELVAQQAAAIHQGACPKCGGPGPVDVHTSHFVWSALVMTSWKSNPQVCCRACGVKAKLGNAALSGVVGWWGFPWGVIMTPVQVGRNLFGVFSAPDPERPSEALHHLVRVDLASRFLAASQNQGWTSEAKR